MYRPQRSEGEQLDFFQQVHDRFHRARAATTPVDRQYRIGGTTVRLQFAGDALVRWLTPALAHLRVADGGQPDLTIGVWDSKSTGIAMVAPPCKRDCFTNRGDLWGFGSARIKSAFHWIESSVNLLDLHTSTGVFWVQAAEGLPFWVMASPLRTIMHWWLERNGCQLLHAAAVGTAEGAVLITGKGGVGKSTTALSCLQAGFRYLGDDYVAARLEPSPSVMSLYCTAKVNADHLASFPGLAPLVANADTLDRDKAVLLLAPSLEDQLARELPLRAILTPRIAARPETTLSAVRPWEVHRAMAFTTMSQLPHVGRHTHEFIGRLVAALPHGRLELGCELGRIPAAIRDLLAGGVSAMPAPLADERPAADLPLVTVVIPVYNGERFLREAVDSILLQDYPALEIIVVNDGSTDRTDEVVQQLPVDVRYLSQDNSGPAAARNRGIRDASGEFIAFLDVDDLWPKDNLRRLVDELVRQPELEVVRGHAQLMERSKATGEFEFVGNPEEAFPHYVGAALYRRSAFGKVGLFDPTLRFGEDSDWFVRAAQLGLSVKRLAETTLHVRRHEGNMTEGRTMVELNVMRVFKKALDRSRAQSGASADG